MMGLAGFVPQLASNLILKNKSKSVKLHIIWLEIYNWLWLQLSVIECQSNFYIFCLYCDSIWFIRFSLNWFFPAYWLIKRWDCKGNQFFTFFCVKYLLWLGSSCLFFVLLACRSQSMCLCCFSQELHQIIACILHKERTA